MWYHKPLNRPEQTGTANIQVHQLTEPSNTGRFSNDGASAQETAQAKPLPFNCLSLDLEVRRDNNLIHALAATRSDTGAKVTLTTHPGSLNSALSQIDELARGAELLVGHNIIAFDIPHLTAANPH